MIQHQTGSNNHGQDSTLTLRTILGNELELNSKKLLNYA